MDRPNAQPGGIGCPEDVQALVTTRLTGDLRQLGWFRQLPIEGQEIVASVIHSDDAEPLTSLADALMRMAVLLTGYEIMLGAQAEHIVSLQSRSFPGIWTPN